MSGQRVRLVIDGMSPPLDEALSVEEPIWIGRDASCDVVLSGLGVSRRHVSIEFSSEGGLRVSDASMNGTLVDGLLLRGATRLLANDSCTIRVGSFEIEVSVELEPDEDLDEELDEPTLEIAAVEVRRWIHRRLLEHLDLPALDRAAMDAASLRPRVVAALRRIVAEYRAKEGKISWNEPTCERLVQELTDEALGLGPLESLLADADVSEILVVDPHTIFVERRGRLELTGLRFTDDDSVRAVIERIVTPLGRRIDESTPLVDARLRDGSRVNAVIPPLALRGPCITIRKFAKDPLRMPDLVQGGSLSPAMARFLERSVRAKCNVLIAGGTGSGKTTLLNVLSAAIPRTERVVTVEDAAELRLLQPHVVSLEVRPPNLEGKGEYSIRDLVKNALRMRPDRIVVGECRGGEALDMLQAMNTGHEGSLTTTHANSPREALARVETLCLMAGLDLPVSAIRRQIASSIHLVVQQTRFSDGARRVQSIAEVLGIDDAGELELREIFCFSSTSREFVATGYLPSFTDKLIEAGLVDDGEIL